MKHDTVLALGVFDLFHVGHLRYLRYARQQARQLTVAVTPDAVCQTVKGKRPVIREAHRLEIIRGLGWVDEVRLQLCSTEASAEAAAWISGWGICHVVAGGGWAGSPRWTRLIHALAEHGITVSFAPQTEGISTTRIVAMIRNSAGVQDVSAGNMPETGEGR